MNARIRYLTEKYDARIRLFVTPLIKVSSHELRKMVKEGKNIAPYVPKDVAVYITRHHLYQ